MNSDARATMARSDLPIHVAPTVSAARAASHADIGRLVLRLAVGLLILLHGVSKLKSGPGVVVQMLQSHGLPGVLAYGVYIGEIVAPLLIVVGLWTRAAAAVVIINMLAAIALVHAGDLFKLNQTGGWAIELQAMYLFGAVVIALLGAGALSIGGRNGRWN